MSKGMHITFNYNMIDGTMYDIFDVYPDNIKEFQVTQEMIGASSAPYQLPRMYASLSLIYDESDTDEIKYWFSTKAKKGMLVMIGEPTNFEDQTLQAMTNIIMVLESFSIDEDARIINIILTSFAIDTNTVVQNKARETPTEITKETLAKLGLKNVIRLTLTPSGQTSTICVDTADEALLALAWGFDGKRHNIGFTPATGIDPILYTGVLSNQTQEQQLVLIPTPAQPTDSTPRYKIEPGDLIEKETLEQEPVVTNILTGILQKGQLVPVIPDLYLSSWKDKPLGQIFKTFTKDGELIGYFNRINDSDDENNSLDYIVIGKNFIQHASFPGAFAFVPGYAIPSRREKPVKGTYVLYSFDSYYDVSVVFYDSDGNRDDQNPTGAKITGSPMEVVYSDDDAKVGSFNELTISDTASIILPPAVSCNPDDGTAVAYIVKTASNQAAPTFKKCQYYVKKGNFTTKPYKAVLDSETSRFHILSIPESMNLNDATIASGDVSSPDTTSSQTGLNMSYAPNAVHDWTQAEVLDFGNREDALVGLYIVYRIPSTTAGTDVICVQTFYKNSVDIFTPDPLKYIQVDHSKLLGVHAQAHNKPLIIVYTDGWYSYDMLRTSGSWFVETGAAAKPEYQAFDEMYNGKQGIFVLSRKLGSVDNLDTRTVYVMGGADNPFELATLGQNKATYNVNADITYNARDLSFMIDLPNMATSSAIPKLSKKLKLRMKTFYYRMSMSDTWHEMDVQRMAMPLLGTLCKYKIRTTDSDYQVAIISGITLKWDGLYRLTLTLTNVDVPQHLL